MGRPPVKRYTCPAFHIGEERRVDEESNFSADGTKMVATTLFGAPYFLSTVETGFVEIGGGCGAGPPSSPPDGGTIVGYVADDQGIGEAAKWLGGQDWLPMGSEPGGVEVVAKTGDGRNALDLPGASGHSLRPRVPGGLNDRRLLACPA